MAMGWRCQVGAIAVTQEACSALLVSWHRNKNQLLPVKQTIQETAECLQEVVAENKGQNKGDRG